MFADRTVLLPHDFRKCVNVTGYPVRIALLRGKCPACFGKCRLEEMPPCPGYEGNCIKDKLIHHTHTQQSVYVVRIVRSRFRKIADFSAVLPPFVQHGDGVVGGDMVKCLFSYFVDATTVKTNILAGLAT